MKRINNKRLSYLLLIIFIINTIFPINIVSATTIQKLDTEINNNIIIENGGFENGLENWNKWSSSEDFKVEVDNSKYVSGNTSMKISNDSNKEIRGIVSYKKIDISNYIGKNLELTQSISSEKFNGELQIRLTFLNLNGDSEEVDTKNLLIDGTNDWENKTNYIFVPNNEKIQYLNIEYIYNNSIGTLWIDDINININDENISKNIIKNGSFEDDFSYWTYWKSNSDFSIRIDNNEYKNGKTSQKISSISSTPTRGIISQKVNISDYLGKTVLLKEWIKSKEFKGNVEIRFTFLDNEEKIVGEKDTKSLLLKESSEWIQKNSIINIPSDSKIVYMNVEYIFNDFLGELWVDDITTQVIEVENDIKIIKNGGFEDDISYWKSWGSNNDFSIEIDELAKSGENSIKIYNNSNNITRGMISQKVYLNEIDEKSLKIQQEIKSENFKGEMQIRATFYDENSQQIGISDSKTINVTENNNWNLKSNIIEIPTDMNIDSVNIDYIYNNATGIIWIDDIDLQIIDSIKKSNIIKNGDFEEGTSYWNIWKENNELNIMIDNDQFVSTDSSLHIYNNSNEKSRAIISQNININKELIGRTININQLIKTQELEGENVQVRIKFKDSGDNELCDYQLNTLGLEKTEDWKNIEYNIYLPDNDKLKYIQIEYVFEKISGNMWIDDIVGIETIVEDKLNLVQNGSFESTINNPITSWYLNNKNNETEYTIDKVEKIEGNNSLKITNSSIIRNTKISQTIDLTDDLRGKTIKISEYIKSISSNVLSKSIRYVDIENNDIISSSEWNINLDENNGWIKNSNFIVVPFDEEIKKIVLEYNVINLKDSIYIDDIRVEPYIGIEKISIEDEIIELKVNEVKQLNINVTPNNYSNKNINIKSSNEQIFKIENNNIIAVSNGIAKIIIQQEYENLTYEVPVVVKKEDKNSNIIIELEANQGEYVADKINIQGYENKDLEFKVLIEGKSGNINLQKDGSFKYYLNKDFIGEDSFIIEVNDNNSNIILVKYNITVKKKQDNILNNNCIILATENNNVTGKINVISNEKIKYYLDEDCINGNIVIYENGNYSFKPNKGFSGYDKFKVRLESNNETNTVEYLVYVAPSIDKLKKSITNEYPRLILKNDEYENIKNIINNDELAKSWFSIIKKETDPILELPVVEYKKDDEVSIDVTTIESYIEKLSFMYKFTGDKKYADRALLEIKNVCNYTDWNDEHFLDTSALAVSVSIAYDCLYDYLTTGQRAMIENAIIKNALEKSQKYYNENSGFDSMSNNWNIVCNSAMIFASLAIANQNNYDVTLSIVQNALLSIQNTLITYYSDGATYEGPGYWDFATSYLIFGISSIENALGINNPFEKVISLSEIATFPIYINSTNESFNFADSDTWLMNSYYGLWFARKLNESEFTKYSALQYKNTKHVTVYDLLWYDPKLYNNNYITELDKKFNNIQLVTMRSSFVNDNSAYVGFKGGTTGVDHGDLDVGNFIFDALGVRWAEDLGSDNYFLPGYWDNGTNGQRWKYYRKKAEGHNTLIIGKNQNEDQVIGTTSNIIEEKLNENDPYVILDMTPAYGNKAINVERKVQLANSRKDLIIEDSFVLKNIEDVIWQMHTTADIEVLDDGNKLILSKDGKTLEVNISSDCEARFEVVAAVPYEDSPKPVGQSENSGVNKIIAKSKVKSGYIKVELSPNGDVYSNKSIVSNGNFEEGLNSWSTWDGLGNIQVIRSESEFVEGKSSVSISSKDGVRARGSLSQVVDVSKYLSTKFKLGQWIKSNKFNGELLQRVSFFDINGALLEESKSEVIKIDSNKNWTYYQTNYDVPEGAFKINIEYIYDGTGEIWIDDVSNIIDELDINEDGIVDILDLSLVGLNYNKSSESNGWYEKVDINMDKFIDLYDLVLISRKM